MIEDLFEDQADPGKAKEYFESGTKYFEAHQFANAVNNFQKAINFDPKNDVYRFWKGFALYETGDVNEARSIFERIKDFSIQDLCLRTGDIFLTVRDFESASKWYEKAGRKDITNFEDLFRDKFFEKFFENFPAGLMDNAKSMEKAYGIAESAIPDMDYTLTDIVGLLELRKKAIREDKLAFGAMFKRVDLGTLFDMYHQELSISLAALINKIIKDDDVIELDLRHMEKNGIDYWPLDWYPGLYLQRGTVIVKSYISSDARVAEGMTGGTIIIKKNTYANVGNRLAGGHIILEKGYGGENAITGGIGNYMKKGTKITIHGGIHDHRENFRGMEGGKVEIFGDVDSGERFLYNMKGGLVIIHGDCRDGCHYMEDGEVIIEGKIGSPHIGIVFAQFMQGGTIRVKGGAYEGVTLNYGKKGGKLIFE